MDDDAGDLLLLIAALTYGAVMLYSWAAAVSLAGVTGAPPAWPLWVASMVAGPLLGYCWGRLRSG